MTLHTTLGIHNLTCVCIHMYVMYVWYTHWYTCTMYVSMYVCMYVSMYVCMYVMCTIVHTCTCIYIYLCTHMYHVYTHIHELHIIEASIIK
jgi:hypothetical protein